MVRVSYQQAYGKVKKSSVYWKGLVRQEPPFYFMFCHLKQLKLNMLKSEATVLYWKIVDWVVCHREHQAENFKYLLSI